MYRSKLIAVIVNKETPASMGAVMLNEANKKQMSEKPFTLATRKATKKEANADLGSIEIFQRESSTM